MSYTKTNWQSGDVISAEKLNKMEDGITSAYTTATSAEVKADSLAETIIDFNNLETVEELGENDKVLVNSGGSVKEADASLIGGSGGGGLEPLIINMLDSGPNGVDDIPGLHFYLDKTTEEIYSAMKQGRLCIIIADLDTVVSYYENGIHGAKLCTEIEENDNGFMLHTTQSSSFMPDDFMEYGMSKLVYSYGD